MDETRYEKAMELMKDEEFFKECIKQESTESVKKLFESKGIELSVEEINAMRDAFILVTQNDDSELNDEQLEGVAGGSKIGDWFKNTWHEIDTYMDERVNREIDKVKRRRW